MSADEKFIGEVPGSELFTEKLKISDGSDVRLSVVLYRDEASSVGGMEEYHINLTVEDTEPGQTIWLQPEEAEELADSLLHAAKILRRRL